MMAMKETAMNSFEFFVGFGSFVFLSAVGIGLMIWLIAKARKELE